MNDKRSKELYRTKHANMLIKEIAMTGRKFFNYKGSISYLYISDSGKIYFNDSFSRRKIYTHNKGTWKGFTNGSTLKTFIEMLRDYIKKDKKIPGDYWNKKWSEHYLNPWGYSEDDLEQLRCEAIRLGITNWSDY